jgi:hypothetical protein
MKVVYLVGPYRAGTEYDVHRNIQAAEKMALEVWRIGACCICPHKNTAYLGGSLPDSVWLEGDLELLRRSDAILLTLGWSKSPGCLAEFHEAEQCGIRIFYTLGDLGGWLASP